MGHQFKSRYLRQLNHEGSGSPHRSCRPPRRGQRLHHRAAGWSSPRQGYCPQESSVVEQAFQQEEQLQVLLPAQAQLQQLQLLPSLNLFLTTSTLIITNSGSYNRLSAAATVVFVAAVCQIHITTLLQSFSPNPNANQWKCSLKCNKIPLHS